MFDVKHHFVPQFLLKAWAETTKDAKVEVFRLHLPRLPSSRRKPEYTGYEDNLYTLTKPEVAGVEQQAVETEFLQRIDSEGARVLHKMKTAGLASLTQKDLYSWVYFIASLLWRAPQIVLRIRAEAPDHLRVSMSKRPEEYDSIAETDDPPTLCDFVEKNFPGYTENFGMMSLGKLICDEEWTEKILRMKWWLFDFNGQRNHLFLADWPCVFTTDIDKPDLVVALPIGPWKVFLATKTDRVASTIMQQSPEDLLKQINESSLMQAKQRIYARDASPRRFISNHLVKQKPL